jgi:NADH-quinone oxidoreductase subunit G
VNSNWIPDSHRLNFKYLHSDARLSHPQIAGKNASWKEALESAATALQKLKGSGKIAMVASARLTNEELYLAKTLATHLGIQLHDVLPRLGEPDGILIPEDRNPNTTGAQTLGVTAEKPGASLDEIVKGVRSGKITSILSLGEDLTKCGFTGDDLSRLELLVVSDILPNATTAKATVLLPASGWAEKRGSMINIRGRLQRLNKAVDAPGEAREDWEIFRDLAVAVGAPLSLPNIEDVFRAMAQDTPVFSGLNLSKIGDLGVALSQGQPAAPQPA